MKPQKLIAVILLAWGTIGRAQSKPNLLPKWVPEKGYRITQVPDYSVSE